MPYYAFGFISGRDSHSYVATGLQSGQLDAYDLYGSKLKFILASALSSALTIFFAMFGLLGCLSAIRSDPAALPILWGSSALWLGGTVWAVRYLRGFSDRTKAAIAELKQRDAIASVPEDERFGDLRRISRAIRYLQAEHGSSYDDQARKAVVAIIEQNRHQPDEKHVAIAHSDALDEQSKTIRIRAMEAMKEWRRDVANAEQLILGLEEAAGIRAAATA